MDPYQLGLYGHFLALVAAVVASSILHFNIVRLRRATSTNEARDAVSLVAGASRMLPGAALALFLSGAFLTSFRWGWQHGWIAASIAGLISMPLLGGIVLKPRLAAIGQALGAAAPGPVPAEIAAMASDRLVTFALNCNHATSLLIMLVMVTKPAGATAAGVLLLSPAFAAFSARRAGMVLQTD